eukprot:scaffold144240_cov29-Tisochrysis_lutea.AAC.2
MVGDGEEEREKKRKERGLGRGGWGLHFMDRLNVSIRRINAQIRAQYTGRKAQLHHMAIWGWKEELMATKSAVLSRRWRGREPPTHKALTNREQLC